MTESLLNKRNTLHPIMLVIIYFITAITPLFPLDKKEALMAAYPDFIKAIEGNTVHFKDGTTLPWDDGIMQKNFYRLLMYPDFEDMMSIPYTKGKKYSLPFAENMDPGRIRYLPFFKKMYGSTKRNVERNLVTITWLPKTCNKRIRITRINGVDKKLKAVSDELDRLPAVYRKYICRLGGTFNFRNIRSEKRLSAHSFGIAIDINPLYSDYWLYRWPGKKGKPRYRNRILLKIVEIFERHGFIWGGKWYHYDTMHFEYRPELLL